MFLTLEDPNAKIKGSRDPLGAQPIWAAFGRHVVTADAGLFGRGIAVSRKVDNRCRVEGLSVADAIRCVDVRGPKAPPPTAPVNVPEDANPRAPALCWGAKLLAADILARLGPVEHEVGRAAGDQDIAPDRPKGLRNYAVHPLKSRPGFAISRLPEGGAARRASDGHGTGPAIAADHSKICLRQGVTPFVRHVSARGRRRRKKLVSPGVNSTVRSPFIARMIARLMGSPSPAP